MISTRFGGSLFLITAKVTVTIIVTVKMTVMVE